MFRFMAAFAVGLLTTSTASAQTYDHPHMWGGGWGMMIFGPFMMIAVIVAIIVVAVLLLRWLSGDHIGPGLPPRGAKTAPLDILKERFARGEIDKEEFEERKRLLAD